MKQDLIDLIRSRGYWRINFQPVVDREQLTLPGCMEVVEKYSVSLRGWSYPLFPRRSDDHGGLDTHDGFYQGWIDWENHKEFWRMYQSGQFLHYIALREDWVEKARWLAGSEIKIEPMTKLGIVGSVVYQLTEIFEFLFRLTQHGLYEEGVIVNIELRNTEGRELWLEDRNRVPLYQAYRTAAKTITVTAQPYSKAEIIAGSSDVAIIAIRRLFDRFGWHNPPQEAIKKDQQDLLTRRV